MSTSIEEPQVQPDWQRLHALGLPPGSIRALLAILIFATTWGLLILRPSNEVPDYLRDLLFIIMGHYFAARHRSPVVDEGGPPPLFLPRGSVRLILVLGTAAVAIVLQRRGQLTTFEQNPGAFTLVLVGGFLLGVVLNTFYGWWKDRGHSSPRIVEDLRAIVSLVAAVALVGLILNRLAPVVPQDQIDALFHRWFHVGRFGPEHILAAFVGFYFGSRS
jgi:hypothetical protein